MNKFIRAIKNTDLSVIENIIKKEPKWIQWSENNGKNALHYLCGLDLSKDPTKIKSSLQILKLLIKKGININSVHKFEDNSEIFPATPLWYAYTRGRNETLFTWLLANGADPSHCMFAIAWYDDIKSAALFKKYGALLDEKAGDCTPFLAAFMWKRFNMAEWLLKNGANVNFQDAKGNTALFYAVKRKYKVGQVELLLKCGADFNRNNNDGLSPKKLAESNRKKEILSLFATR